MRRIHAEKKFEKASRKMVRGDSHRPFNGKETVDQQECQLKKRLKFFGEEKKNVALYRKKKEGDPLNTVANARGGRDLE